MRIPASAAFAALLGTTAVSAQDAFTLNTIIFSAGLTALEAARTGVSVEVVTAEELEAAGDQQLSDFLATLPGISVTQTGPIGTNTTLRIRGLNGNYIPVLINGIDITDPASTQTSFNFGTLNTGGLGRIEVLYGSQSAIYGSEAIAGVINITTLEPPEEIGAETTVNLEAGSYNTYSGTIGYAQRFDRGSLAFSLTRLDTEGFSAADENQGNTEADGHDATTLTVTGEYDLSDTVTIGGSLFVQDSYTEFDSGGGVGGDGDRFLNVDQQAARIFARIDGGMIDHELALQYSLTDRTDPTAPVFFTTTDFEGERLGLSYQGTVDLGPDRSLVLGAEHVEEDYLSFRPGGASFAGTYSISSVVADYNGPVGDTVDLNAALRYDQHSEFGGALTGRLALAWRPNADTVVRASLATGFRAPSLNELFGPFGANPDLEPEQSRSVELGIERDLGRARVGAALFYTEIDDLIIYTTAYNQVPGTSVSQGVELSAEVDITDEIMLFGNYTYTDARDRNDDRLARVPHHDLTIGIRGEIGERWSVSASAQAVMDRQEATFPAPAFTQVLVPTEDYVVANASVGYAVNDSTEVYLRVDNIFDEQYQSTAGYGTSDRAFYLGLRARF